MATDWQMPRRSDACCGCGVVFEPGANLTAILYDTLTGYERRDFCDACQPPADPSALGSWRTRRPMPTTRKTVAFDREAVLGFFQRLTNAESPEQLRFRFVLALLLWRKKALKFESSDTRSDGEYWRFTSVSSKERWDILRPELDEEEIDRLSKQLESLLASVSADALETPESATASDEPVAITAENAEAEPADE